MLTEEEHYWLHVLCCLLELTTKNAEGTTGSDLNASTSMASQDGIVIS